ncbi:MAG: hypothetical protein M1812_004564 [Candelaria pacifica]|nr:MAG: hypothetical protein M1812_004564 [Candelaria pacifica]
MHPERSPTLFRPNSPLSPTMSNSMLPPTPRLKPQNTTSKLKLSNLPRYHPANYPSSSSISTHAPPGSAVNSSYPPTSPRQQHHRHYSDAQKQLHSYQREMMNSNTKATKVTAAANYVKPISPRLAPMGSPGPVTPLLLEEESGYLVAGTGTQDGTLLGAEGQKELIERLIKAESQRCYDGQRDKKSVGNRHR